MRCLDKCAIQRKSCQHSTPICHRAWPAIPSTIAQLVHHLQRSVSSLDWKRTAQRPAEQRTQVAPWYAPWSRPSADSKKIFADFIYPRVRRFGWSQRLEIIKYQMCHLFVMFLSFRKGWAGICVCVIFLSSLWHVFAVFLSWVCHLFVILLVIFAFSWNMLGK